MKEDTILVQCRFDLTDSEVAAAARKRAVLEGKMADLDAAFAVQKEKHKNVVGLLEKDAGELGMLIRRGFELRDAECRIEFDYEGGLVNTVRVDTGEIVKTRPMTDSEKSKGLPLPLGPSILLSESDPDAVAAKTAEPNTDASPPAPEEADHAKAAPDGKECGNCHHLRTYHLDEDGKDCFCWQPDCDCEAFLAAPPSEEAAADAEDPSACVHCSHPEGVHGTTRKRGCMRADCQCKAYVHQAAKAARKRSYANPEDVCLCGDLRSDHHAGTGCDTCECTGFRDSDPLGVADVHPEPEKREAEL